MLLLRYATSQIPYLLSEIRTIESPSLLQTFRHLTIDNTHNRGELFIQFLCSGSVHNLAELELTSQDSDARRHIHRLPVNSNTDFHRAALSFLSAAPMIEN